MSAPAQSLDEQRRAFAASRLLAMPLAGTLAWLVVAAAGRWGSPTVAVWTLFIATGGIAYLGIVLSRFTGEHFLNKRRPKNAFDGLFMHTVAEAMLVYAIAIPFFLVDWQSLPLTVGVLTGIMWLPLAWIIRHWVGYFHALARTAGVVAAWYAWPDARFVAVPLVIVAVYLITIVILERRWRHLA